MKLLKNVNIVGALLLTNLLTPLALADYSGADYVVGDDGVIYSRSLSVYGDWTSKTSNSPAARAGFDESERFGQQLRHQQWLKDKGRNYDRNFDSWLR